MFHQIRILECILKDHVTLKTGVMTAEIKFNYSYFKLQYCCFHCILTK